MKVIEKIKILADAAKYDASCSSSGGNRPATSQGIGNTDSSGICHSWSADGRCISLLKVLLSNDCLYDCRYCPSRRSNQLERATFTAEELATLTIDFYLRNYIEGLFLSSAVFSSADATMAEMVETCRLLRTRHRFNGYIHLKVIPGADAELVHQAGLLADRLSVNIELPSEASLRQLAPQKSKQAIFLPMSQIGGTYHDYKLEQKKSRKTPLFCPAGQSTQMIIGATRESDLQILNLSENLYAKMQLKRVFYSAYIAVNNEPNLPTPAAVPPLLREHRLYQADWLLRFYRFKAHELLSPANPFLAEDLDPKAAWAIANFDHFPLDINRASYSELLRVPGIGVRSARRIVQIRRNGIIRETDLAKIGLVTKRARFFLSINGKYLSRYPASQTEVARALSCSGKHYRQRQANRQLRLF